MCNLCWVYFMKSQSFWQWLGKLIFTSRICYDLEKCTFQGSFSLWKAFRKNVILHHIFWCGFYSLLKTDHTQNVLNTCEKKVTFSWHTSWFQIKEWQLHSFLASALDEGEWSASHSGCFTTMKESWYSLNRQLGGPQSRSGHFWEEKNLWRLMGSDHNCSAHGLGFIPTTLPHLPLLLVKVGTLLF
jgi:hypothetical protein